MYANWTDEEIQAEIYRLGREASRRREELTRKITVEITIRVDDYFHVVRQPRVKLNHDVAVLIESLVAYSD